MAEPAGGARPKSPAVTTCSAPAAGWNTMRTAMLTSEHQLRVLRLPPFVVVQMSANKDTAAAGLVLVGLVGVGSPAVAAANQTLPRIRSSSASLAALIARVTEHSATFRALIDAINASDGIVYVEAGECGHDVTACLVGVTSAGCAGAVDQGR